MALRPRLRNRHAERQIVVTVERTGNGHRTSGWWVKATDSHNPTIIYFRQFRSDGEALAFAAAAASGRFIRDDRDAQGAR